MHTYGLPNTTDLVRYTAVRPVARARPRATDTRRRTHAAPMRKGDPPSSAAPSAPSPREPATAHTHRRFAAYAQPAIHAAMPPASPPGATHKPRLRATRRIRRPTYTTPIRQLAVARAAARLGPISRSSLPSSRRRRRWPSRRGRRAGGPYWAPSAQTRASRASPRRGRARIGAAASQCSARCPSGSG